jgi:hypothetical protein
MTCQSNPPTDRSQTIAGDGADRLSLGTECSLSVAVCADTVCMDQTQRWPAFRDLSNTKKSL